MAKFQMGVTLAPDVINDTARLGGAAGANPMVQNDQGKFVKFAGDSRYDLCAAGDKIEGIAETVQDPDKGTYDGYNLGGVRKEGRAVALADGLEATPGTGTIAVGDYVVCGTVVAKGTALGTAYPKVCKATNQPGTAIVSTLAGADTAAAVKTVLDAALVKAADGVKNSVFAWRVVSILAGGTGAVGDKVVIERVNP